MKTAQEFRAGQVANINGAPWVIQKAEFNKSGRNAAVVKMKLKNLLTGAGTETVFKADDKLEPIILDRKEVTYLTSPTRCTSSWTASSTSTRSRKTIWKAC